MSKKWYHNKATVGDLFDGIRNYVLCGMVFYSGVLSLTRITEEGFVRYIYMLTGVLIVLLSLYLFFANFSHLRNNVFKLQDCSKSQFWLVTFVSSLFLVLGFLLLGREALNIEVNGKPLGETKIIEVKSGKVTTHNLS